MRRGYARPVGVIDDDLVGEAVAQDQQEPQRQNGRQQEHIAGDRPGPDGLKTRGLFGCGPGRDERLEVLDPAGGNETGQSQRRNEDGEAGQRPAPDVCSAGFTMSQWWMPMEPCSHTRRSNSDWFSAEVGQMAESTRE